MVTYVLIMVLSCGGYQCGSSTITQEFNTFEKCESARKNIEESIIKQDVPTKVRATGCFKK